jgi:hypothetical protein
MITKSHEVANTISVSFLPAPPYQAKNLDYHRKKTMTNWPEMNAGILPL